MKFKQRIFKYFPPLGVVYYFLSTQVWLDYYVRNCFHTIDDIFDGKNEEKNTKIAMRSSYPRLADRVHQG